jgi:hypothetical protein
VWSKIECHPPLLPDFAAMAPYGVVIVELAESPELRLVGNIVSDSTGRDRVKADDVSIGEAVVVTFVEGAEEVVLPQWTPARDSAGRAKAG